MTARSLLAELLVVVVEAEIKQEPTGKGEADE
jgi:hypothetical protein